MTNEQIQDILMQAFKKGDFDLTKVMNDPAEFEKALLIVYKAIPIPTRWVVGKKRIRNIMNLMKGLI